MKELWDIKIIREILERHRFNFSKSLGQNFLVNRNICPAMAQEAVENGEVSAIEIGPGIGILTQELALRAKKVLAVEIDTRLLPVLDETLAQFDNVEILNADILKLDIPSLIEEKFSGEDVVVCANLPYYITSPVIMHFLESKSRIKSLTVMVQKEAADRLCAEVGSREAGAVSVAVNYYAEAQKLFNVSKGSFYPQPKVDSAVIKLTMRREPPVEIKDEKLFFRVVKAAFSQRRKTAANGISSGLGADKSEVVAAIEESGLDPNVRAEKLTMEQLARLTDCIKDRI
ncbi:MAG: 16S rRNA (adenine(1518)-N(6)/adenine(1519)-N(6))-dimethyltransferase RsmA [Clostridia bacterium]|nr:16S rRNA (adenine(1518)-N(6)/adenine(1519)-N(6))-dimethyltransferase RsmA [Clostridia bacterium]